MLFRRLYLTVAVKVIYHISVYNVSGYSHAYTPFKRFVAFFIVLFINITTYYLRRKSATTPYG